CCTPHFSIALNTSNSVELYGVNSYFTVTGLVLQTSRLTNPFISNSCNSLDKMRGEIPASLDSSLKPFFPLRKHEINTNFHFPPTTSNVSRIAKFAFAQLSPVCFFI